MRTASSICQGLQMIWMLYTGIDVLLRPAGTIPAQRGRPAGGGTGAAALVDAAVKVHYMAKLQGRITRAQSRLNVQSRINPGRLTMQGRFVIGLSRRTFSSCQDRQRTLKTTAILS